MEKITLKLEKITIPIKQILPSAIKDLGKEAYQTEIRFHPLLKWFWAAIATSRADYKPYIIPTELEQEIMTPRVHYFTDPIKYTPRDPIYNQLQVNDAVCFPNLWSWAQMAICRITGSKEESVLLKDIKVNQLSDAFQCTQNYFQIQSDSKPNETFYPTVNMNYLRPSASSIVHPHFQILNLPTSPPLLALILQECKKYHQKQHQDFFTAYMEQERDGPRWIGEIGTGDDCISWVSPWAPLAGTDEILFSSSSHSAFPLPERTWQNIAEGLHKIFVGYHEISVRSVNMILCSDIFGTLNESFRIFGMIWSRPLKNLDISDHGFAELGHKITLTFRAPEMVAEALRKHW
jgi:UDPglucose--hexose-1-phosphate uridylyltransferase